MAVQRPSTASIFEEASHTIDRHNYGATGDRDGEILNTLVASAHPRMDRLWLATSRLRRRRYDECIALCDELLEQNAYDSAVWYLKCRALTRRDWIDDTEVEEEGVAEVLLDDNAISSMPRPGTSLNRPQGTSHGGGGGQGVRPISSSGRPLTGFSRPGSNSGRQTSGGSVESAFRGSRPGTSRPVSSSGRFVRLGTASMLASQGLAGFIDVERMDLQKYAKRPALNRVLCDYLAYHEHNYKKCLELCANATVANNFQDWWWKARLGKAYYQLGMFRDAEKQFKSSLHDVDIVTTTLELCKVHLKLDQPKTAIDAYEVLMTALDVFVRRLLMHYCPRMQRASETHNREPCLVLGLARVYDALNEADKSVTSFKRVLSLDSSNVEAIACLASHYFYTDQPEIALRYYRRLLQIGVNNTELWNNLGLCCIHAGQYDMTLSCFQRALELADDENMADVWYNISQVAIGIGDLGLAYQTLKIAVSIDSSHAESYNNLGVLELRKGNIDQARSNFMTASRLGLGLHMFEPAYNGSLLAFKVGDFQECHDCLAKALALYPDHGDSIELQKQLRQFVSLV